MNKLLAVLSLTAFQLHSNFWGGKPYAKLDEDQLQAIEDALEQKENSGNEKKISELEANETSVQEALTAALELNGIEAVEGQSVTEAIAALGAKCKEYGDSTNTHSTPPTNGKEKNAEEDPSANYEHNKVMADKSKFKKIL